MICVVVDVVVMRSVVVGKDVVDVVVVVSFLVGLIAVFVVVILVVVDVVEYV